MSSIGGGGGIKMACPIALLRSSLILEFDYWITIEKSKAILYHADISERYYLVCQLKIVFYF